MKREILGGLREGAVTGYRAKLVNAMGVVLTTGLYAEEDHDMLVDGCNYAKLRGYIASYSIEHDTEKVKAG